MSGQTCIFSEDMLAAQLRTLDNNLVNHNCQSWQQSVSVQTSSDRARGWDLCRVAALLPSDVPPVYLTSLFYFYCLRVPTLYAYIYIYVYMHERLPAAVCHAARRCCGAAHSPRALGTQSISVPRLLDRRIITSRSAQIRDYSPDYSRGDRTKSARACGTSAEEIFLTARCHRVRPTEITDEDSERSSTPVTVQERAGGRGPLLSRGYTIASDWISKRGKNDFAHGRKIHSKKEVHFRIQSEIASVTNNQGKKVRSNVVQCLHWQCIQDLAYYVRR